MSYLQIKSLSKSFDKVEALKDINIEVEKNEVITIIGGSGNGKTTLLRCLAGLEIPNGGEIYLENECIYPSKSNDYRFGFVFQNFNLFPQYTVLKNITLALDLNIKDRKRKKELEEENIKKASALLKLLNLEEKSSCYPYQLSGGQKQRVAIARALALNPSILLFDEPTSALDPKSSKNIGRIINELKKDYTIIVVSHDLTFAKSISNRLYFLEEGKIEFSGTPTELEESTNIKLLSYLGNESYEE